MQYMPGTWAHHSQQVYGQVMEKTPDREWFVAVTMIERWIEHGHSEMDISKIWNQGHTGKCSSGVNKHGVRYDSCAYVKKVLALLK
jgi:hypothetical protein